MIARETESYQCTGVSDKFQTSLCSTVGNCLSECTLVTRLQACMESRVGTVDGTSTITCVECLHAQIFMQYIAVQRFQMHGYSMNSVLISDKDAPKFVRFF